MPRRALVSLSALTLRLQAQGPQTAAQLAGAAGVHRSQISRVLATAGGAIVQIGAARRARYALRRAVRTAGDRWPIFRIDAGGRAQEWGRLEVFYGGFRLVWAGRVPAWVARSAVVDGEGWGEGFPFFLGDLRPQGFVGRALARQLSDGLRVPADPTSWSADDTLVFLQAEGEDLPGDLVVGEGLLRRVLARQVAVEAGAGRVGVNEREARYPEWAAQALRAGVPGSSAGGEQPKFLTRVVGAAGEEGRAVLVKFSPLLDTAAGRRWADLLVAEALAGEVWGGAGAEVIEAGGRRFLELPRFDRVGAFGRRGVVSLAALHGAWIGAHASNWGEATEQLVEAGVVAEEALKEVRRRQDFGELIGNSDMHFGNLAFWLGEELPLTVAPVYDMLPMLWAPTVGGEVVSREFDPLPPTPADAAEWGVAAGRAETFWRRLAADGRITPEFAEISREAGAAVARLRERFAT